MKSVLVSLIAFAFVAAFVGVWLWLANDFRTFTPSLTEPVFDPENKVVEVAGFLAAAVGAATAGFLGIEVQHRRAAGGGERLRLLVVAAGVIAYLLVGAIVFVLWLSEPEPTPEFIGAFVWGVLGWAAGALAAAFAASEP